MGRGQVGGGVGFGLVFGLGFGMRDGGGLEFEV